jgi:hypothetical protein
MPPRKRKPRKPTLAERARAARAADPSLTTVQIQHAIGARSHQQVQAALRAQDGRPGPKPRGVITSRIRLSARVIELAARWAEREGGTAAEWIEGCVEAVAAESSELDRVRAAVLAAEQGRASAVA